jgi:uncharacterized metal-binding protein (TIGR02443 family)
MTVQRRFIAGAACPDCGAVDRIQRCIDGDNVWMECVACGMQRSPEDDASDSGNTSRIDVRTE